MTREARLQELATAYAMRYINTSAAEPTDAELHLALDVCVVPARVEWYPAIRAAVYAWRGETGLVSRIAVAS